MALYNLAAPHDQIVWPLLAEVVGHDPERLGHATWLALAGIGVLLAVAQGVMPASRSSSGS